MRSSGATTARRSSSSRRFPFTANQWQELEHQALVHKYIISGIPIPPHLLFSIKTSLDSPNSKLMLHHPPNSFKNNYGHGMMKDEHPFFSETSKNVSDSWHLEPLTMGSSKQRNCSNIQNGYSYLQSRPQKQDEQQQYYHEIGLKMEREEEDEGDLGSVRSDCPTVWLTLNPARLSDLDDPHSAGHIKINS